jgi:hypothetical protein
MKTPILYALDINDFGAYDLSVALSIARANSSADAYDDPDGSWVFIAKEQPTKAQIKAWKRKELGE